MEPSAVASPTSVLLRLEEPSAEAAPAEALGSAPATSVELQLEPLVAVEPSAESAVFLRLSALLAVCRRHYKSCNTRGWDAPLAIPLRLTESNTPNLRCCLWSASLMSVVTTDLLVRNLRQLRRHWQESERRLAGSHLRAESPLGEVAKESPYPFLIAPA